MRSTVLLCMMFCTLTILPRFFADEWATVPKNEPPKEERFVVPPVDSAFPDWVRLPYTETVPDPVPTEQEKIIGFIPFTRPLIDAIYPETRPRSEERFDSLRGFGAWEQYETLNFAIWPLSNLTGVRVQTGDLKCGDATIPADRIETRLVTYRDNTYPQYNSRGAWRRLPEYLQNVTVFDAPKHEPQRICITINAPVNLPGGLYRGTVLVSHNGFEKAVAIPVVYELFPFKLNRDPKKNFSAYYYNPYHHELVRSKKKDETWAREAMRREFATMVKYGFTVPPVWHLECDSHDGKYSMDFNRKDEFLSLVKENGMHGPMPVIGGGATWIYYKMTGKSIGNHITVPELPPQKYYDELTRMAVEFKKKLGAKGESVVFGPLDEIAGNELSSQYGHDVYAAYKKGGLTTYTTMEPTNSGFALIDPVIDIFASQVYLPLYEETQTAKKAGYWCYPNHNSYERKDPIIMNKGGRMTYGYGYWRSGFDLLVPWIWRNGNPKHFYEKSGSGGGNILHPETGDVIMTIYWENFREGINDLNYLYTLQNAIVRRAETQDAQPRKTLDAARRLLKDIWDDIEVQEKYLAANLWPSEQFDGRRYQVAQMIAALSRYPESNTKPAPSVLVESTKATEKETMPETIYRRELERGNVVKTSLFNVKSKNLGWTPTEKEASVEYRENMPDARTTKAVVLNLNIDLKQDGTGNKNGSYPAGWPAMNYAPRENFSLTDYDLLLYRFKLESNRTQDKQPKPARFYFMMRYGQKTSGKIDLGFSDEVVEGAWVEKISGIHGHFYDGISLTDAKLSGIRLGISESSYRHGNQLRFIFDDISLISFKKPFISKVTVASVIPLLYRRINYAVETMGPIDSQYKVRFTLLPPKSDSPILQSESPLAKSLSGRFALPEKIEAGVYRVRAEIFDRDSKSISVETRPITLL